ncbi:MAG: nucleotidyltransferase family protein [Alphaproteobacteria bacterium]|nr:MAG: hypothetical protein B6I23_03365 [Rickettsiaceae bacterium 4572_127]
MEKKLEDYRFFKKLSLNKKIEKILVFGSYARNENTKSSDLDLAILAPKLTESEFTKIYFYLNEEADTLTKIDLIHLDNLKNGVFKQNILREGKVVYEQKSN